MIPSEKDIEQVYRKLADRSYFVYLAVSLLVAGYLLFKTANTYNFKESVFACQWIAGEALAWGLVWVLYRKKIQGPGFILAVINFSAYSFFVWLFCVFEKYDWRQDFDLLLIFVACTAVRANLLNAFVRKITPRLVFTSVAVLVFIGMFLSLQEEHFRITMM